MSKYPIKKEFFPFQLFTPPISRRFVQLAQKHMKTPRLLWRNPALAVDTLRIPGWQGAEIEVYLLTPKGLSEPAPCFVYFHGGGFVFEGSGSHFRQAMTFAKEGCCKVAYVRYRLAPAHPFPAPQEDCYAAYCWLCEHAEELGIDSTRIGVGGDSAGGTLTAAVCLMARDRGAAVQPMLQLLIYPWLDGRNNSESCRRFTDTPLWNSALSKKVSPLIDPDPSRTPLSYRSPVEAETHLGLPPAYIEVAQFDCLHDDGVLYAQLLRECGIPAQLHEVEGAMHGFDTAWHAPTTQAMVGKRVDFLKKMFG